MKVLKKILWGVVIALVILVVGGVITATVFLNGIVKKGVETVGPQIAGVSVKLNSVHLSLLTGSVKINGLVIGNPKGYKTPQAISVGTATVEVNPLSVFSDKIVVRAIHITDPEITFEGGLSGNNLSKILDNVNATAQKGKQTTPKTTAQGKPGKKIEVDDFLITGAKVHASLKGLGGSETTLPLPPIHLTDLGKGTGGITAADLAQRTLDALVVAVIKTISGATVNVGKNVENLTQGAGKQVNKGVNKINKGIDRLFGK